MSSEDAKSYLSKREVPRLFESMMTGLMFHRPDDHIEYLIECLQKVKSSSPKSISWDLFVDLKKSPLPPISPPVNGKSEGRTNSRGRSRDKIDPHAAKVEEILLRAEKSSEKIELNTQSALPPIGQKLTPDKPIVLIIGGPGSGKLTQVEYVVERYTGWVHISMGDLIRQEIREKGSAEKKWDMVNTVMASGEMAPEDVTGDILVNNLKNNEKAVGFVIEGYPRDLKQVEEFERLVGRVDLVIVLDCNENYLKNRLLDRGHIEGRLDDNLKAISKRIMFFKQNTLPVIKHYDDQNKAVVLEGERESTEIASDIFKLFDDYFYGKGDKPAVLNTPIVSAPPLNKEKDKFVPHPPSKPKPNSREKDSIDKPDSKTILEEASQRNSSFKINVKDTGRKEGLPQAPIVFFAGGPGSGKGTQCKKLVARYSDFVHLSMGDILRTQITTHGTVDAKWDMISTLLQKGEMAPREMTIDLLLNALKEHEDAKGFIIEGFPRDVDQLEEYFTHIGGLGFAIVLDCEEYYLQKRLVERGEQTERIDDNLTAISNRLNFFKQNTLPVLRYIDDEGKLVVVPGDRDEAEIFYDLCKVFDMAFYGKQPQLAITQSQPEGVVEEVIEASIVPSTNIRTGDTISNPHHTAYLDSTS